METEKCCKFCKCVIEFEGYDAIYPNADGLEFCCGTCRAGLNADKSKVIDGERLC